MDRLTRLPEAELTVMRAVWALKTPARTGDIRAQLEKTRPWNLSALQTLLTRLTDRGFLSAGKEGRQRTYTPLVSEGEYLAFENRPYPQGVREGIFHLFRPETATEELCALLRREYGFCESARCVGRVLD